MDWIHLAPDRDQIMYSHICNKEPSGYIKTLLNTWEIISFLKYEILLHGMRERSEINSVASWLCQSSWRLGPLNIEGLSNYKYSLIPLFLSFCFHESRQTFTTAPPQTGAHRPTDRAPHPYVDEDIRLWENAVAFHTHDEQSYLQRKVSLSGTRRWRRLETRYAPPRPYLTAPRYRQKCCSISVLSISFNCMF